MQTICTSLQTDNHTRTSSLQYLQAGHSSWCPTNSVKALKARQILSWTFAMQHKIYNTVKTSTTLSRPYRCRGVRCVNTVRHGVTSTLLLWRLWLLRLFRFRKTAARGLLRSVNILAHTDTHVLRYSAKLHHLGLGAQNETRGAIYKIYDYLKFIVRSTYDTDLQRSKISLMNHAS